MQIIIFFKIIENKNSINPSQSIASPSYSTLITAPPHQNLNIHSFFLLFSELVLFLIIFLQRYLASFIPSFLKYEINRSMQNHYSLLVFTLTYVSFEELFEIE
jgi:hypothetical protein